MDRARWLLIGLLVCAAVAVIVIGIRYYFMPPDPEMAMGAAMGMPHQNHRPQHGGQFFMAEDNIHHLEGVLLQPGTFRLYLYDAYTMPLPPEGVKETVGTLEDQTGKKIPLGVSSDGNTLEAEVGPKISFPTEFNVRLHLAGQAPDKEPELFTFDFDKYSVLTNTGVKQ